MINVDHYLNRRSTHAASTDRTRCDQHHEAVHVVFFDCTMLYCESVHEDPAAGQAGRPTGAISSFVVDRMRLLRLQARTESAPDVHLDAPAHPQRHQRHTRSHRMGTGRQ